MASFVPYNTSKEELVMEFLKNLGTNVSEYNSLVIRASYKNKHAHVVNTSLTKNQIVAPVRPKQK